MVVLCRNPCYTVKIKENINPGEAEKRLMRNMKNFPMMVMLIAPYCLFGIYAFGHTEMLAPALIVFVLIMVSGAGYAFFLPRMGFCGKQLLFWCMLLKICNIPLFLMIFATSLLLFVMMIPLLPILAFFDWLLVLSTSMYGISGLLQCGKEKKLTRKDILLHIVLQCIFCADVCSAVYCYFKAGKNMR